MSAPNTDTHKQFRRHIGPVLGIVFVVVMTILGFIWWLYYETDDPQMPGEKTGAAEEMSQETQETNAPAGGEAPPE